MPWTPILHNIFHCKRDNSGDFQWLAVVWISSSLICYLQLCNNLNIKNFNFLFITDEEEKISLINFVLKNLIESLSYLIIYNRKLTRNCDEFHIIKDELLLGLITLLLWWGEGDFACHNCIQNAILTFNDFRFVCLIFIKNKTWLCFTI